MELPFSTLRIRRIGSSETSTVDDRIAIEEPLEIQVTFESPGGARPRRSISVTMRTPGADLDLAAGFLYTEGIIADPSQIDSIQHCAPVHPGGPHNVVRVDLRSGVTVDLARLERHFYTSSSCGVCGKTSIDAVAVSGVRDVSADPLRVSRAMLCALPETMRAAQAAFDSTGGLHAAALFDREAALLSAHEDVGRHNAVDKVIGSRFRAALLPARESILLVSGRAGFELVQKALMARIPMIAAIGAPSSLAIDLASRYGMTVIGFLRSDRFNIYCGEWRVE